jgi:signal peptidase I
VNAPKINWKKILIKNAPFIIAFIVIMIFFRVILLLSIVPSGSMEPTIKGGSVVLFNRLSYIDSKPQRGDVVVFYHKESNKLMVKRVVGTEGDIIDIHDGVVFVNGENELLPGTGATQSNSESFTVPDGHVFLLGDNRDASRDARFWENPYVSVEDIKGEWIE